MSEHHEAQPSTTSAESPPAEGPSTRVSRRNFLRVSGVGGAAVALTACQATAPQVVETAVPVAADPSIAPTTASVPSAAPVDTSTRAVSGVSPNGLLPYPRAKVGTLGDLGSGAFSASYPDEASPIQILKLGSAIAGGVGSDNDIVAYSALCTHMGCPVGYDAQSQVFRCPCHFSQFDAARDTMMVNGPATQHLPRVALEIDGQDIYAVGVQGLIYGRPHNLSLTQEG